MTRPGFRRLVFWLLWAVTVPLSACGEEEILCGHDLTCQEGEVCVHNGDSDVEYRCVENPCGSDELSCACAQEACGGSTCRSAEGHNVSCYCLAC